MSDNPAYGQDIRAASKSRRPFRSSKGWYWESTSFLLAVATFGGIVALLLSVQNKPVPKWPSELSVNAILSVLVTVMKGAMGVTIAESLSQLKWKWFSRERNLKDLETLDEASRGVWGAGTLLLTFRGWYLAYLGAFIFLVAFIIGPTVQQMVQVVVHVTDVPSEAATVPVCNASNFEVIGLGAGPGMNLVQLPVIGAAYDGLLQTTTQNSVTPFCPSGNCTFAPYQSLGFCNECIDLTDELVFSQIGLAANGSLDLSSPPESISLEECQNTTTMCTAELPKYGIQLEPYGIFNSTRNITAVIESGALIDVSKDPVVGQLHAILKNHATESRIPTYSAVQCLVRACIKTYEGSVASGKFTENITSTTWKDSSLDDDLGMYNFQNNLTIPANPCYINGERHTPPYSDDETRKHCLYKIYSGDALSISNTLDDLLEGDASASTSNRPNWSSSIITALWGLFGSDDFGSPEMATLKPVQRAMDSLATMLTNHVRSSPAACSGASVAGTQTTHELYLRVRWVWLIPAAAVLALCAVFFAAVIVSTWNDELWKSSPLAYLAMQAHVKGGGEIEAQEVSRGEGGFGGGFGSGRDKLGEKGLKVRFATTGGVSTGKTW